MDDFTVVGLAEGFIEGTETQQVAVWQHLIDTAQVWQLQGWFGRTAHALIQNGICHAAEKRGTA